MLTCEICGEEILLEEDMKTHLLLIHVENEPCCPFCSLSVVSYDELCFHISVAHQEQQQRVQTSTCTAEVTPAGINGDPAPLQLNSTSKSGCSSLEEMSPAATSPSTSDTRQSVKHCNKDNNEIKPQHSKAKQKRRSLTSKEKPFPCPVCGLVCISSFLLQEHVESHLEGSAAEGSPVSDLELARQLQQQEEEQRRRHEEAQEEKEFKKLQRQFGLDGRGGYRRQLERNMESAVARGLMSPSEFHSKRAQMMESLASGVDDNRTRTQGVVRALYEHYQSDCRDCAHVWLSADTDHFCSSEGDKGWGCGYRNFQMLLSCLHGIEAYSPVLQDKTVPSIPRVQSMIEDAWREGLDPQGASHFDQRLQGTRAWIGATEIYCLLTSLRISARIIDFHQPTGPGDTHPRLFDWVRQYFSQASGSSRLPPRLVQTSLPPLYLQHQGHSRSIVGLEQRKNGSMCLLILDPNSSVSDTRRLLSRDAIATAVRQVRKFPSGLKHKQYQVVAAQGMLSAEEKQISIANSRTLCAERIP